LLISIKKTASFASLVSNAPKAVCQLTHSANDLQGYYTNHWDTSLEPERVSICKIIRTEMNPQHQAGHKDMNDDGGRSKESKDEG